MSTLWTRFDGFATGRGLLADWQAAFGQDFERVKGWIEPTGERAPSHPCVWKPPCGCRHEVRESRAGPVAVCVCGDGRCEAFPLEGARALIHRLDGCRFRRKLGDTLGLAPADGPPRASEGRSDLVGTYVPMQAPVYLAFVEGEAELVCEIERLRLQRPGPFVLLTPTRRFYSPEADAALGAAGALGLALTGLVDLEPGGNLRLIQPLEPLLAPWQEGVSAQAGLGEVLRRIHGEIAAARHEFSQRSTAAERLPEEDALRLFALVRELDPAGAAGKAPLLQVFRLYCLEGLAAEGVARRCGCSKTLIIRRLGQLRRKLGRNPAELRAFAGQFEAIEKSVGEFRGRRLSRHSMLYGN